MSGPKIERGPKGGSHSYTDKDKSYYQGQKRAAEQEKAKVEKKKKPR